jgi:hypothetical protein
MEVLVVVVVEVVVVAAVQDEHLSDMVVVGAQI